MNSLRVLTLCLVTLAAIAGEGIDSSRFVDEGEIENGTYTSHEIGWRIQIPEGWTVVSAAQQRETAQKGADAIEESHGPLDYSGLKNLISFKKDDMNVFQSSSEPFEEHYEGEWLENYTAVNELLVTTYENAGLQVDADRSKAIIDGLEFEVLHLVVFDGRGNELLRQDLYARLMNGYDFGVGLSYNNESARQAMMAAWEGSRFGRE